MSLLDDLYEEYHYPSASKLLSIAKKKNLDLTKKQIDDFINQQDINQRYKQKEKKNLAPIVTDREHEDFQMDLLDFTKFGQKNKGLKWTLLVIDIFTRKGYARAIKSKEQENVLPALKEIMTEGKPMPTVISTDNGNEFKGSVDTYMKQNKIIHRTNIVDDHHMLGVIDRFSKTIKNILYKYMDKNNTTDWSSRLQKVIDKYNETPHSTMKDNTPDEMEERPSDARGIHYERVLQAKPKKDKINVGDFVRILTEKHILNNRSFHAMWSREIYVVEGKDGARFRLNNGKEYKQEQLQLTQAIPQDDEKEPSALEEDLRGAKVDRKLKEVGMKQSDILPRERSKREWQPKFDKDFSY